MKTSRRIRVLQYVALGGFLIFLGFPLVWLMSTSLKTSAELNSLAVNLFPSPPTFQNYGSALVSHGLVPAAVNSVIVSVATTVIVMVVSVPGAYTMARRRGILRTLGTGWVMVSQIFPAILIIIPLFLILKQLGLIDSLVGLTAVYVTFTLPFSLWMLQGFIGAIPYEIEEAGAVDGASRVQVLIHLVFPLLRPGLVAAAMFTFVMAYNEFFFALVILQTPSNFTLPVALSAFVGSNGRLDLGPLAAAALLACIPSIVFFTLLQRRLGSGLLAGSVKG